jgi:hypothetical protein
MEYLFFLVITHLKVVQLNDLKDALQTSPSYHSNSPESSCVELFTEAFLRNSSVRCFIGLISPFFLCKERMQKFLDLLNINQFSLFSA